MPLFLAVVFVVVKRWLAATPPERRVLEPILWAGPPVLVVAALAVLHDYLGIGSAAIDWLKLVYAAIPAAFLVGILRTQLHRAAVGDLATEVGQFGTAGAIRDALAQVLDDPSLQLAFELPSGRYVDADGRSVQLDPARATTTFGDVTLIHDEALLQDPDLLRSTGAAVQLALSESGCRPSCARRSSSGVRPRMLRFSLWT